MPFNNRAVTIIESKQKRLDFFKNLLLMSIADGYLDQVEGDFLVQIGRQLDLTAEDVAPLAEKDVQDFTFSVPESDQDKLFELQTMVMMMVEDGEIDDREYKLCADYCDRIGLNHLVLEDFVQKLTT